MGHHAAVAVSRRPHRAIPSVERLLRSHAAAPLLARWKRERVVEMIRLVLGDVRRQLDAGGALPGDEILLARVAAGLDAAAAPRLQRVVNATGVILHTNLGRAPLGREALQHVVEVSQGYSNLEMDLASGARGERDVHVDRLFAKLLFGEDDKGPSTGRFTPRSGSRQLAPAALTPAERLEMNVGHPSEIATIVVNNNAAAVLLTLNALAEGGEVIVSRGELVEIGGSFRIPDVMAKSGAVLREVGTTNRTRVNDYEQAINERTKLLLRVHRSNFEITGFTEQPTLEELSALARKRGVPLMEDLGSGDIFDLRTVGVHGEPTIAASLRAGVDIVTFSGDKLLGGPQAGLITGKRELVAVVRKNPLFRALRVDKVFYAALEATLLAYLREDYDSIPTLRMMRLTEEQIGERAEHLMHKLLVSASGLNVEVVKTQSVIGGGSAPGATLASRAVAISSAGLSAEEIAQRLRRGETPIVARVEDGRVLLDLRTVEPEQDEIVLRAVESLVSRNS